MNDCKPIHDNIYDFLLKNNQIVNSAAFNSIFQKFVDNDKSLLTVKDDYTYGPKTLQQVEDYYLSAKYPQLSSGETNPKAFRYLTQGYKVWQNINTTPTTDSIVPGSRQLDYDVYQLRELSSWLSSPSDRSYQSWLQYKQNITDIHTYEESAWKSSFEDSNINTVESATNQYLQTYIQEHLNDWHKSYQYSKEINLAVHNAVIRKEDNKALVISADLPQQIRKITSGEYFKLTVSNPYTRTQNEDSEQFFEIGTAPTGIVVEYASGMKSIYVNIPTTKTFWIPFVTPTELKYYDGRINFYNLPYKGNSGQKKQYFGLNKSQEPTCVDVSNKLFVTDFKLTVNGFNVTEVMTAVISNESPALNRIQFGYSANSSGEYSKQHGGDNSWYPPSILVEQPIVNSDGSVTVHGCCFGSDSQNLMIICR